MQWRHILVATVAGAPAHSLNQRHRIVHKIVPPRHQLQWVYPRLRLQALGFHFLWPIADYAHQRQLHNSELHRCHYQLLLRHWTNRHHGIALVQHLHQFDRINPPFLHLRAPSLLQAPVPCPQLVLLNGDQVTGEQEYWVAVQSMWRTTQDHQGITPYSQNHHHTLTRQRHRKRLDPPELVDGEVGGWVRPLGGRIR